MDSYEYVFLYLVCFCNVTVPMVSAQTFENVTTLQTRLLKDYDKYLRPFKDLNDPVIVNVTFGFASIKIFDEVSGEFTINGFLTLSWYDHRLTWDPKQYNNTFWTELHISKVWTPTIAISNSFKELNRFGKDFYTVFPLWNGLVIWTAGDVISSTCTADVTYYPFDKQTCTLEILPWGFSKEKILLKAYMTELHLDYYIAHGTWDLLKSYLKEDIIKDTSFLYVEINMRRRPAFFIVTYILPILFMISLNILVFFLPVESGERMSYSITVLLAVAVFLTLVGENLPKTSEPMSYLCYFLLGGFILSAVCCCMTIMSLKIYYKPDHEPVPTCFRALLRKRAREKSYKNSKFNVDLNLNVRDGHLKETQTDNQVPEICGITWKMVSSFVDKVMIVLSILTLCSITTLYLAVVVNQD